MSTESKKVETTPVAESTTTCCACPLTNMMTKVESCDVMTWKCMKKTGTIVAVGNVAFLAIFFEMLSMFVYPELSVYLALLGLIGGAALKFSGKGKELFGASMPENIEDLCPCFTEESVVKAAKCAHCCANKAYKVVAPVLFWSDITVSAATALGLYVFTIVLGYISLFSMAFLTFNGAFVYGKFHKEIKTVAGPHMEKAKAAIMEVVNKIPIAKKTE